MDKNIKYSEAVKRLDEILSELEDDDVDIDDLSARVKEAVELLRTCKTKIDKVEIEVKQVIEDIAKENKKE